MTLEQFASLAEIIGVILVIASLVYVAKQLHQNTAAILAQSRQAVLGAAQQELYHHVENPGLSVAAATSRELTPEEHVQVSQGLYAAFRIRQFAWLQFRDGTIDEAQWQTEVSVLRFYLDSPRVRKWWSRLGRAGFGDEYADFVDGLIATQPPTNKLYETLVSWTSE